jgi:hypothetical protein
MIVGDRLIDRSLVVGGIWSDMCSSTIKNAYEQSRTTKKGPQKGNKDYLDYNIWSVPGPHDKKCSFTSVLQKKRSDD